MFGKQVDLFELVGFKVRADASWLILAVLVTWSLAKGYFPLYYSGLEVDTYWLMGVAGAIGLFLSIIFHELSHAVVARHYGMDIKGITLFIFGGVAEMEAEPAQPMAELLMAIAGPIASLILAVGFHLLAVVGEAGALPINVLAVLRYLALINLVLALFNLVPAFPLDGGRVLRALLWQWKGDLRWSTRQATRSGEIFGLFLIAIGVMNIVGGNLVGGMWWFVIGLFLRGAANASYYQLISRRLLEGQPLSRFMTRDPVTVPPDLSLRDLIEDYIYAFHHDFFPVVDGDRVLGLISVKQVKDVPRNEWHERRVAEVMQPASADNSIALGTECVAALSVMRRSGNSRLLVVDRGHLAGVLALKDLLEFLSLKIDLDEPDVQSF